VKGKQNELTGKHSKIRPFHKSHLVYKIIRYVLTLTLYI